MVYRTILPEWARLEYPNLSTVQEGEFSEDQLKELNAQFYNIYFLPNYPSVYNPSTKVDGSHIDTFRYVYVDMDLKDAVYKSKEEFIDLVKAAGLEPTAIVDSGNGVHAYWQVDDLDSMNFLKLQRRLIRKFNTDEAVAKIYQLMRVPDTVNTKYKDDFKLCCYAYEGQKTYTCEDLDKFLPPLTHEDEQYCQTHFNKTYQINQKDTKILDSIPPKFNRLIKSSKEAKDIWCGNVEDRSVADYRLGHLMFAHDFTREEAASVLVNTAKARSRAPIHRVSYAEGIVDKIWTFEQTKATSELSYSVKDILQSSGDNLKGTRFACNTIFDDTDHGFRLGQVIGLVSGSGVGKTAVTLNMFKGFVENNAGYVHFFVSLEQPANEIADRWRKICGDNVHLHDKVHVISNYDENGAYRNLSLDDIKDYLLKFKETKKINPGCVVIDHIGALKRSNKDGRQSIEDICHRMKALAVETGTLLVMQSQAPREKAGIGDIELNKDAAYGTVFFECYCDYLITMWQPLKRCYNNQACPTVTAFKFCKIRHKSMGKDKIKEDICYTLYFDPNNETLHEMTQEQDKAFSFFNQQATSARKKDRRTEVIPYQSRKVDDGKPDTHSNNSSIK